MRISFGAARTWVETLPSSLTSDTILNLSEQQLAFFNLQSMCQCNKTCFISVVEKVK